MKPKITVLSNTAAVVVASDAALRAADEVTSFPVQGAFFTPSYRQWKASDGRVGWDGRKHLMPPGTGRFPLGLLHRVLQAVEEEDGKARVKDRIHPPVRISSCRADSLKGITLRKDQTDAADALLKGERGILWAGTGAGKTEVATAMMKKLIEAGLIHKDRKILFLTGRRALTRQTRKRIALRLGVPERVIGLVGEGKWEDKHSIVVCTINTLGQKARKKRLKALFAQTVAFFVDEAHHVGSQSWYSVIRKCKARFRFGLSGTPLDRSDGRDLMLIAATGEVLYEIRTKTLVAAGVLARPTVEFIPMDFPPLPEDAEWADVYKLGVVRNPYLHEKVVERAVKAYKGKHRTLIFVNEIEHGKLLDKLLWSRADFIPHEFVHAGTPSEDIQSAIDRLDSGDLPVLISSPIFREGIDIPHLDVVIIADGGESVIKVLQQVGRGMRRKGGSNTVRVVDFANTSHPYLAKHSLSRLRTYLREGFKVI